MVRDRFSGFRRVDAGPLVRLDSVQSVVDQLRAFNPVLLLVGGVGYEVAAGVPAVVGDPCYRWCDQSGNGYHAVQSVVAKRPQTSESGLIFNGMAQQLATVSFPTPQPTTVITHAYPANVNSTNYLTDGLTPNSRAVIKIGFSSLRMYAGVVFDYNVNTINELIICSVFNGVNSRVSVGSSAAVVGNSGNVNGNGLVIGGVLGVASSAYNGIIENIAIFNRSISDQERLEIVNILQ